MKIVTITKERAEQLLPKNIQETTELSEDAKKVLAVLINYIVTLEVAKNDGAIAINNEDLTMSCEFGKTGKNEKRTLTAVQELVETKLVVRQRGKKWVKGEKPMASKYFINWDNLNKPVVKPTLEDLLKGVKMVPDGICAIVSVNVSDNVNDNVNVDDNVYVNESDTITKVEPITDNNLCNNKTYSLHNNVIGKTSSPVEKKVKEQVKTLKDLELKKLLEEELRQWAERVNNQKT